MAEKAGVTIGTWSTGATFGDYDGDGYLDLFVDGYAQIDLANRPSPDRRRWAMHRASIAEWK